jgi:hypothetical protein
MASHSHRYHHNCYHLSCCPRFVRVGWNPTWCNCANHAIMLWLRLWNLSNCIQCPCCTYMRCLSTLSGCSKFIRLHIHINITKDTSPELWESAEILPDASVQTMPLQGQRTFHTASHVHVLHIWGVWAPSQIVDGHMASHSHHVDKRFPRFVRVGWNHTWCKCANHATLLWLRL